MHLPALQKHSRQSSKKASANEKRRIAWSDLSTLVIPPASDVEVAFPHRARSENPEDTSRDAAEASVLLPRRVSTPVTSSSQQEGAAESRSSSKQEGSTQSWNSARSDQSISVTLTANEMDVAISPRLRSEGREDTSRDAAKAVSVLLPGVSTPRTSGLTQESVAELRAFSKQGASAPARDMDVAIPLHLRSEYRDAAEAAALLLHGISIPHMSNSKRESATTSRSSSKQESAALSRKSRADTLVSWSSPCWEEAHNMLQQDSCDGMNRAREQTMPKREMAQWDILTLRQWFNMIDVDRSGGITRHEWFDFIVKHPKFRDVVLGASSQPLKERFSLVSWHHLRHQAVQTRKVMKMIKDLDTDSNGMIQFDEFVEFFRRTGRLVEYQSDANPMVQMADFLGDVHSKEVAAVSDAEARQVVQLAKQNLQGRRRKQIERKVIRQVAMER